MAHKNEGMRFSPKPTKNKTFCSVYNCSGKASRDPTVRFHRWPKPGEYLVEITNKLGNAELIDRRKAWNIVLKYGKRVTENMRVCLLHFTENDYLLPSYVSRKRYLKDKSVPSCNLPENVASIPENLELQKLREKRSRQRSIKKNEVEVKQLRKNIDPETMMANKKSIMMGPVLGVDQATCPDRGPILERKPVTCPDGELAMTMNAANYPEEESTSETVQGNCPNRVPALEPPRATCPLLRSVADIGVQVSSGDIFVTFVSTITTDEVLGTFIGIPTLELSSGIEQVVKLFKSDNVSAKLTIREVIIMTFMKLKQNMSYAVLSTLFKCYTPKNCSLRVHEMLDILSKVLRCAMPWPTKDDILRNIPQCLKDLIPQCFSDFEDVRIILDCTEIAIQQPKKLCWQIRTYSHYKGRNTVKFMTGVTPGGLISFISEPYGGRCSDKYIFVQSGLVNLLDRNDAIMVDKGFLIDEICTENDSRLLRPPFLKNKKQFSSAETLINARIARARVHIERSNQRLKTFQILGEKLPGDLLCEVKEIFTIISAVVNLSAPILKDDKFMSQVV